MRLCKLFRSSAILIFIIASVTSGITNRWNFGENEKSTCQFDNCKSGQRMKRGTADDVFNDFYQKITMAARVFSGISLRIGLHDSSIPSDEAISELLNLEYFTTIIELMDFNGTKMNELFKKINELTILDKPLAIEKSFLNWNLWQEKYEKLNNLKNPKPLIDYIDAVEKFKSENVDESFFNGLDSFIGAIEVNISKYEETNQTTLKNLKLILKPLEKLPQQVTDLLEVIKRQKPVIPHKQLEIIGIINELIKGMIGSSKGTDELFAEFQKIQNLSEIVEATEKDRSTLIYILNSLIQKNRKVYLSGMLNGAADLQNLTSEAVDSWITTIPGYNGGLMEQKLSELNNFTSKLLVVKGKWDGLNSNSTRNCISLLESFNNFDEVMDAKTDWIDASIKKWKELKPSKSDFLKEIKELIHSIHNFNQQLFFLVRKLTELSEMKEFEHLKDLLKLPDSMPNVLLNTTNLKNSLKTLRPKLKEIENATKNEKLKDIADLVVQKKNAVKKFFEHTDTIKVFKFFDEMKPISPQLNTFANAIRVLQGLRKIKADESNFTELVNIVNDSVEDVRELRAISANIKSIGIPETEFLSKMEHFYVYSEDFGEAVVAIDSIRQVINSKPVIDELLSDGWKISKKIESDGDVEKERLLMSWGEFGETWMTLKTMQNRLEDVKSQLTLLESSLTDYTQLFSKFRSLSDFEIDIKSKLAVVEELISIKTSPEAVGVKNEVKELENLDFSFSKYQNALAGADEAFQKTIEPFGPVRIQMSHAAASEDTKTSERGRNGDSDDLDLDEKEEKSSLYTVQEVKAIGASILVGMVFICTAAGIGYMWMEMYKIGNDHGFKPLYPLLKEPTVEEISQENMDAWRKKRGIKKSIEQILEYKEPPTGDKTKMKPKNKGKKTEKSKTTEKSTEKSKDTEKKTEKSTEKSKDTEKKTEKSKDEGKPTEKSKDTEKKTEKSKDTEKKTEKSKEIQKKDEKPKKDDKKKK